MTNERQDAHVLGLVESYRTAKGSRQHVVSSLGELAAGEESGWARLGRHLNGKASAASPIVPVRASASATTDQSEFGFAITLPGRG